MCVLVLSLSIKFQVLQLRSWSAVCVADKHQTADWKKLSLQPGVISMYNSVYIQCGTIICYIGPRGVRRTDRSSDK